MSWKGERQRHALAARGIKSCSELDAIREFGTTPIPEGAGFILSSGELLNFSKDNQFAKWYTHDEIKRIGCKSAAEFMQMTGAIRLNVTSHSVWMELHKPITDEQRRAIAWLARRKEQFVVDIYTPFGHYSKVYTFVNPAEMINDINRRFEEQIPFSEVKKELKESYVYSDAELKEVVNG